MFNEYVTFGESLLISLFCMVVVFIALLVISYIVDLTKVMVVKKKSKATELDASSIGVIGSPEGPIESDENTEDETELVAVITAAIAMMTGTDTSGFVVKNIRKISESDTAWSRLGRIELMR